MGDEPSYMCGIDDLDGCGYVTLYDVGRGSCDVEEYDE